MAAEACSQLTQAGVCGGTCGVLLASLWFDWALGMGYVYLAQQAFYAFNRSQSQHSQLIEAKGMQKRWKQAVLIYGSRYPVNLYTSKLVLMWKIIK